MQFVPLRNIPASIAGSHLKEGVATDIDAAVAERLVELGLGTAKADPPKPKRKATSESTGSKKSEEPKSKSGD
ncbi:unnamed protein product [marine sediment metagenome]|uniref:Uncharacterized protein n=1 Tax=marine sediment metagenome TaxID=412755 RepID=X0UZU0_9ZZZZ